MRGAAERADGPGLRSVRCAAQAMQPSPPRRQADSRPAPRRSAVADAASPAAQAALPARAAPCLPGTAAKASIRPSIQPKLDPSPRPSFLPKPHFPAADRRQGPPNRLMRSRPRSRPGVTHPPIMFTLGRTPRQGDGRLLFMFFTPPAQSGGSVWADREPDGDPRTPPRRDPAAAPRDAGTHSVIANHRSFHGLRQPGPWKPFGHRSACTGSTPLIRLACAAETLASSLAFAPAMKTREFSIPSFAAPTFGARAPAPLARDRCACSAGGVLGHHPVAADHPARAVPFRARPGRPRCAPSVLSPLAIHLPLRSPPAILQKSH